MLDDFITQILFIMKSSAMAILMAFVRIFYDNETITFALIVMRSITAAGVLWIVYAIAHYQFGLHPDVSVVIGGMCAFAAREFLDLILKGFNNPKEVKDKIKDIIK